MSVLFYRRPEYCANPIAPLNPSDCARYVERAKKSEGSIPEGLGFDDIVKNKALPPCSLNDFMDYLTYVERNAENLQFYLCYRSYVCRFDAIPDHQSRLSPKWIHEQADVPALMKTKKKCEDFEKPDYAKARKEAFAAMQSQGFDPRDSTLFGDDPLAQARPLSVLKDEGGPSESVAPSEIPTAEITSQAGLRWQPFTVQPFRDEINHMIRHYLAFTSPRELNLSHRTRALVLHALQHTTHPSAFHPALLNVEVSLRGQSHPNFIRWSICNGSKPRILFVRGMAACTLTMGAVLAVLLVCSQRSRWWRLWAGVLWWIGGSGLIASARGLCIILHHSHSRMLRPWEEDLGPHSVDIEAETLQHRLPSLTEFLRNGQSQGQLGYDITQIHLKSPLELEKSSSLSAFGPKNRSLEECSWYETEKRRVVWRKIFRRGVWTQEERLRVLQDRIVLSANVWAAAGTVMLLGVVVSIPELGVW